MTVTWKNTLYDYVHHRNQMEIDYTVEPIAPFVADQAYLSAQTQRLRRRANMDLQRGITPAKSETRLVIERTTARDSLIIADIKLKRVTFGRIREQLQVEGRVERERVTLSQGDSAWHIVAIEPLEAERAFHLKPGVPGALLEADEFLAETALVQAPSVPYLNPQVVTELSVSSLNTRGSYNRQAVAAYADRWWDKNNPAYQAFGVDCSNYVSQCLFAGGAPMNYTGKRNSGWWYKGRIGGQELWSFSWAVANALQHLLATSRRGLRAQEVPSARELDIGDVICYDWDGNGGFQHSVIVTAKDADGMPLVNAHTTSSKHRFWSYTDSPAWTERTRYRFFHISDSF